MTIWSDEIQELCRLVAYEKIAAHLVDQFHTQAVRFFLEGFFYGERPELTERLKQLGKSTASGTEPEAILTSSFLIGSYAPLSQALFESYAPSFSLPCTGEHKGGKVVDLIANLGTGTLALVEVKELFARGGKTIDRGERLALSRRVNKRQVQLYAEAIRGLQPAFLLVTNIAEWFLYDEEAAHAAKPIEELNLEQILEARESNGSLGPFFNELARRT